VNQSGGVLADCPTYPGRALRTAPDPDRGVLHYAAWPGRSLEAMAKSSSRCSNEITCIPARSVAYLSSTMAAPVSRSSTAGVQYQSTRAGRFQPAQITPGISPPGPGSCPLPPAGIRVRRIGGASMFAACRSRHRRVGPPAMELVPGHPPAAFYNP